jgi:hypothetical protein
MTNNIGAIDYLLSTMKFDFIVDKNKDQLLPSGAISESLKEQLEYFVHSSSQTRLRHMILELRHRDKTRMP